MISRGKKEQHVYNLNSLVYTERSKSSLIGAIWAVLAVFLFSIIFISGKFTDGTASAIQIVWLRYFGGLLTICLTILVRRVPLTALRSNQPAVHAVRALAGGAGTVAGIYAVTHLPVASATAVSMTDGAMTTFLAVIFLRERLRLSQWLASFVCLAAAQFVLFTNDVEILGASLDMSVVGIATAGALFLAIENILIKTLSRSEPPIRVLLYVNLFGTLAFLGPAVYLGIWSHPIMLMTLLVLGPIAILGQFCNIRAFSIADASIVAPMRYSWIIFAAIWGAVLFQEFPSLTFYLGSSVVILSGIWLATSR